MTPTYEVRAVFTDSEGEYVSFAFDARGEADSDDELKFDGYSVYLHDEKGELRWVADLANSFDSLALEDFAEWVAAKGDRLVPIRIGKQLTPPLTVVQIVALRRCLHRLENLKLDLVGDGETWRRIDEAAKITLWNTGA